MGDNHVILLTTFTATMLEVYLLQQHNVVNLRVWQLSYFMVLSTNSRVGYAG